MPWFESGDLTTIHYQDWGRGRPVVFVSSWALSCEMWQYQMVLSQVPTSQPVGVLSRRPQATSEEARSSNQARARRYPPSMSSVVRPNSKIE